MQKHGRKLGLILALVTVLGVSLLGCGNGETSPNSEGGPSEVSDQPAQKESDEATGEDSQQLPTVQQVEAYQAMLDELGKAKEGLAVDWDHVLSTYQKNLQKEVSGINGEYDAAILAAIEGAQSGEMDANVARQLVDKLTQSYFYQKQKALHQDVIAALETGDQAKAESVFEELTYLANEVLIPTAAKRDEYYGVDMVNQIENGLNQQETALQEANVEDFSVYVQLTDKSVYRSYYLASKSYAEKIEAGVSEGKEELALRVMQAEAWGFYQAIKGSLSSGDEAAATRLDELFNLSQTNPSEMDAEEVADMFLKAFVGKINGYHQKVPESLAQGDIVKAKVQAMEANVFLKAIELELQDQLGEESASQLMKYAEQWFEAVANENQEEAEVHSEAITTALSAFTK